MYIYIYIYIYTYTYIQNHQFCPYLIKFVRKFFERYRQTFCGPLQAADGGWPMAVRYDHVYWVTLKAFEYFLSSVIA